MYLVACGRYQPFHNGHLSLLRKAARHDGEIVVGVLITMRIAAPATTEPQDPFTVLGDERCDERHNPFTAVDRVRMISAALRTESWAARAFVTPMPRPDLYWPVIEAMLPGPRTWILPINDDPINAAKERYYRAHGDDVLHLPVDVDVSG